MKPTEQTYLGWVDQIRAKYHEHGLPPRMWNAVFQYLKDGSKPGQFLLRAFENDFCGAVAVADDENLLKARQWATFIGKDMPLISVGSRKKVHSWRSLGGWYGSLRNREAIDTTTEN